MSDVTLMEELVELKHVLDANDETWERELVAAERNALQALFSRTERLMRTLSDARREDAALVAAVAIIRARIDAAAGAMPG